MKNLLAFLVSLITITSLSAPPSGTIIVANMGDNSVSFVSASKGTQLSKLPVGNGPHEVAVSPSGKIAAVSIYGIKGEPGNIITLFDVAKREKIKDVSTGEYQRPHGMEFSSEDEILCTSETSKALIRVNIKTGVVSLVASTDQLASHMIAYSGIDKKAYIANIYSGTVSVIDANTNSLVKNVEFKKGIEGIAVSPNGKEVWVANRDDSTVTAMNTATFQRLADMPAHQVAYRVKFLPNGKHALVSNGMSGNISVYDVASKKLITDINIIDANLASKSEEGRFPVPGGMTTSKDGRYVYVACGGYDQVAVIDSNDWSLVKRIDVAANPDGICYSVVGD